MTNVIDLYGVEVRRVFDDKWNLSSRIYRTFDEAINFIQTRSGDCNPVGSENLTWRVGNWYYRVKILSMVED